MPRDIGGPEYAGIRAIAPTALRALGLRTGLTHLEWFRRPDGTVAVSEVAVRPPGAQISSMLCYAARLRPVPRLGAAHGARQLHAAGTRLVGRDGVPARPGNGARPGGARPRRAAARNALPGRRVTPAGAGPAVLGKLRRRRLRHRPAPRHRRRRPTRCGGWSPACRSSSADHDEHRHDLPWLPGRDGVLHPRARGRRGLRHRGGRPAARRRSGHRPGCARALHSGRLPGCRGRCRGDHARAGPAGTRRPGGVPVGAVHDARRAAARGAWPAWADRAADGAVPRQGADEAAARRRRPAHAGSRGHRDSRGRVGGRGAPRLPAHRQADRRRRPADTYRADSAADLDAILPMVRHVPQVSVEEFVDGEEFTYDTICAGGEVLFENICWYRPRPLLTKMHEWISPVIVALRDLDAPDLQAGRALGAAVAAGARLPRRVHPHGVVPQARRRGGVRRDRRPAARRADGRRA